jgi:hypothetical protein
VTEDLTDSDWPAEPQDVQDFWDAIAEVGSHIAPESLWQSFQGSGRDTWTTVLSDDRFPSAIGLERGWFDRHGQVLAEASRRADTSGDRVVHGDLAPGNWCLTSTRRWKFVDWASAYRGNPIVDDVIASVRLTRTSSRVRCSPRVEQNAELAMFVAGRFAGEFLDVDWSGAPFQAVRDRASDIRAAVFLTAHLLNVPAPERL